MQEYPLDGNVALDRILENAKSLNHVECDSVVKVINISPNIVSQELFMPSVQQPKYVCCN